MPVIRIIKRSWTLREYERGVGRRLSAHVSGFRLQRPLIFSARRTKSLYIFETRFPELLQLMSISDCTKTVSVRSGVSNQQVSQGQSDGFLYELLRLPASPFSTGPSLYEVRQHCLCRPYTLACRRLSSDRDSIRLFAARSLCNCPLLQ